ncbi:MAG: hypothetical protein ACOC90_11535, partial [Bacteroidota bacterium]
YCTAQRRGSPDTTLRHPPESGQPIGSSSEQHATVLEQNIAPDEKTWIDFPRPGEDTGGDLWVVFSFSTKNALGQTEKTIRAVVCFGSTGGIDKFIFILAGYVNSI